MCAFGDLFLGYCLEYITNNFVRIPCSSSIVRLRQRHEIRTSLKKRSLMSGGVVTGSLRVVSPYLRGVVHPSYQLVLGWNTNELRISQTRRNCIKSQIARTWLRMGLHEVRFNTREVRLNWTLENSEKLKKNLNFHYFEFFLMFGSISPHMYWISPHMYWISPHMYWISPRIKLSFAYRVESNLELLGKNLVLKHWGCEPATNETIF